MFKATCGCAQLKVSFEGSPFAQLVCHCRDCQAVSGQDFTEVVFFKPEPACMQGQYEAQPMRGGSGLNKEYRRCRQCGEFLYATVDALKGMVGVVAARLEAPFEFKPVAHVWTEHKTSTALIDSQCLQFAQAPRFEQMR